MYALRVSILPAGERDTLQTSKQRVDPSKGALMAKSPSPVLSSRRVRGCACAFGGALLVSAAAGGCGSSASSAVTDAGGTGAVDAFSDEAADAGGDTGDGSLVFGDAAAGEPYSQGDNICCGKGTGTACCPPGTLADPSAGTSSTCFQYGGVTGQCTPEGSSLDAKDLCSICCEGLVRIDSTVPDRETDACFRIELPSVFVCAACGNGTCDLTGENSCNCPADCPK
jgi:hypothetical protein